jgi:DNA segregation ATPase FtsK/SpoIIIE, S-DNA-T family
MSKVMFKNKPARFAKKNRETILPSKTAWLINDATAVLIFAISFTLAAILSTYHPGDNCWFKTSDSMLVHNKFGQFGANLSDILLSVFGLSSWWMVIGLFYVGYRKIIRNKIEVGNWFIIIQFISFIILITSSSLFEYLALYHTPNLYLHHGYGGMLGHVLFGLVINEASQYWLTNISFILMLVTFILSFSLSLGVVVEKVGLILEYIYIGAGKLISRGGRTSVSPSSEVAVISAGDDMLLKEPKLHKNGGNVDIDFDDFLKQLDENDKAEFSQPDIENPFNNASALKKKPSILKTLTKLKPTFGEESISVEKPVKSNTVFTGAVISRGAENLELPNTSLLAEPQPQLEKISKETLEFVSMSIENKLAEFGVEAKVINSETGPVITRYEILPSRGVRGDKVVGLAKEIARGLALTNVRVVETIPGKNSMGIEVPNFKRQIIYLKEIFDSPVYQHSPSKLTLALGMDIAGDVIVTDLARMPHLLVAGTTGSGKSVAINIMILSILFQATPDEVKFIMIDPKMVELSFYHDIPHLLAPVVTDMSQAANALKWAVVEMERRYKIMAKIGCKNIVSFNQKVEAAIASGSPIVNPLSIMPEDPETLEKWPYIVVIIDELADLMMVAGKKIEQYIARLAQKARAIGIHLIVATQRPSVDVITGLIKANIPARISFQVSSRIDSRTVLDQMGAETLLGQGDMLFLQPGSGFPQRIHGAYVNDEELNKVVEFLKSKGTPNYIDEILSGESESIDTAGEGEDSDSEKDPIFDEAVKFIYDSRRCSISSLQTRFGIGYNRAARIMSHLEQIGMVRRNDRGSYELLKTN